MTSCFAAMKPSVKTAISTTKRHVQGLMCDLHSLFIMAAVSQNMVAMQRRLPGSSRAGTDGTLLQAKNPGVLSFLARQTANIPTPDDTDPVCCVHACRAQRQLRLAVT